MSHDTPRDPSTMSSALDDRMGIQVLEASAERVVATTCPHLQHIGAAVGAQLRLLPTLWHFLLQHLLRARLSASRHTQATRAEGTRLVVAGVRRPLSVQ